ncbi:MAG: hypothetical protein LLG40_00985 [Deltaproteobacteria bacterium]|nr:hypothetical protein [Deltaproteobacteria bacterium]
MTCKLTTIPNPAYLHVIVTGENTVENILQYFEEIHRECTARNCFRILIEERLDGPRLPIMKVFDIVQNESAKSRGFFKAIAYVDVNAEDDSMKFAENVGVNRSLPLFVFSTVEDAEKWINASQ